MYRMYMGLDIWWKENKGDVFLDIPDAGEQKKIISYKKRLLFWEKGQCSKCFISFRRASVFSLHRKFRIADTNLKKNLR